ncbi:MAG: hypothetical protein LBG28_02185 [Tannerella sp.]|nr:hypothetical protein [Tannerella sp.]
MRTKHFLFSIGILFILNCCDMDEASNKVVCPNDASMVFTYMIDYTTNRFLGGYKVTLPHYIDSLMPVCEYNSPGDFGDVTWYDKTTNTRLFAGTIIGMGKGERTFPEKNDSPDSYTKLDFSSKKPQFISLYHDKYDNMANPEVDYLPIWNAIKDLQDTSWSTDSTPAYIYLYRPSVGVGDPKDWYWIVFMKY